jgi:hypothetical protein
MVEPDLSLYDHDKPLEFGVATEWNEIKEWISVHVCSVSSISCMLTIYKIVLWAVEHLGRVFNRGDACMMT